MHLYELCICALSICREHHCYHIRFLQKRAADGRKAQVLTLEIVWQAIPEVLPVGTCAWWEFIEGTVKLLLLDGAVKNPACATDRRSIFLLNEPSFTQIPAPSSMACRTNLKSDSLLTTPDRSDDRSKIQGLF